MSMFYDNQNMEPKIGAIMGVFFLFIVALFALWLAIGPTYRVWSSEMHGRAEYAQAEANRRIAVLEAQAAKDSASLKADAEVARAEGVAKANAIIGDSLKGNEDYLRYLYINNLADSKDQIIYIPNEAGLPILEANRTYKTTE